MFPVDLDDSLRAALTRLVEGEAEPADEALVATALASRPALATVLREQLRLDALLRQAVTENEDDFAAAVAERIHASHDEGRFEARVARAIHVDRPTAPRLLAWIPLTAAALGLLLVAVLLGWPRDRREAAIVELAHVAGVVSWSSERGGWQAGLANGAALAGGTLSVEGEMSSATLLFRDGTRVTLTGNSELSFTDATQKVLRCTRGSLSASVTPQPPAYPMLVRTPTAEIEVLGTVFTVDASAAATTVSVDRGRVRVRHLDDPQTAEVTAQQVIVVTAEPGAAPFAPRGASAALARWRAPLELPLDERWSGTWLPPEDGNPARVAATPVLVGATQKHLRPGIRVHLDDEPGPFSGVAIAPGSTLRLRLRSPTSRTLNVFVSAMGPVGGFAGNFERNVTVKTAAPDRGGWVSVEVPLADLPPVSAFREEFPRLEGQRLRCLLITASSPFEVSALEIRER